MVNTITIMYFQNIYTLYVNVAYLKKLAVGGGGGQKLQNYVRVRVRVRVRVKQTDEVGEDSLTDK